MNKSQLNRFINIFLICYITTVNCGFDAGSCPKPLAKQNLSLDSYTGRWYEIFRDLATPFEIG